MTTSRAAVFLGAGRPLEVQEFPVPDPPPGGAIVKMVMAAVCGTDVHNMHRASTPAPMIFGHENVGVMAAAGAGLDRDVLGQPLREGDRVLFRAAPCGKCRGCALGENCDERMMYGLRPFTEPPHITGGFSQYVYLEPQRRWILRIPDDVSNERALISVTGNPTLWRGIQRMGGVGLADTVVVQGSGPMGMAALVQAKIAGAGRVIMIGAPAHRLELALELGATETLDLEDFPGPEARVQKILDLTGGRGADVVMECAGTRSVVQEGIEMTRVGGRYLLVGSATDYGTVPINPTHIVMKGLRVTGVAGADPESFIRCLEAMRSIVPYPVEQMVTHRFALEQANEAFHAAETLEAMVAVITPNA